MKIKNKAFVLIYLAANAAAFAAFLFLGWGVFHLLLLYWTESAIVGFFNVLKLLMCKGKLREKMFFVPFFCVHYGFFMFVHLIFLLAFFVPLPHYMFPLDDLSYFFSTLFSILPFSLILLFPYAYDFLSRLIENSGGDLGTVMFSPYRRIIVMHVTIVFGMFLVAATGLPDYIMVVFVAVKILLSLS